MPCAYGGCIVTPMNTHTDTPATVRSRYGCDRCGQVQGTPHAAWCTRDQALTPAPRKETTMNTTATNYTPTRAERQVLAALYGRGPLTAAEVKRVMPGATPVATIREIAGRLARAGLLQVTSEGSNWAATYRATDAAAQWVSGTDEARARSLAEMGASPVAFITTDTIENGKKMRVRDYADGSTSVNVGGYLVGQIRTDGTAWIAHRSATDSMEFEGLDRTAFLGAVRLVHVL